MPNLGVNIAIIVDGTILMTQREDFEVWCLPGGGVDPGESVAQAAIREALEETGLEVELIRLVGIYSRPQMEGGSHTVLFAARMVGGTLHLAPGETIDARFFNLDALPETMFWWHRQQIHDAFAGVGGSVAWSHTVVFLGDPVISRQDIYDQRDRSGLSRQEFFLRTIQPPGPDSEWREV